KRDRKEQNHADQRARSHCRYFELRTCCIRCGEKRYPRNEQLDVLRAGPGTRLVYECEEIVGFVEVESAGRCAGHKNRVVLRVMVDHWRAPFEEVDTGWCERAEIVRERSERIGCKLLHLVDAKRSQRARERGVDDPLRLRLECCDRVGGEELKAIRK